MPDKMPEKSNKNLVIAEKNSVAKSIAAVLGAKTRRDGFYEGGGYVVSWCVGHLLGLAEPQAYDGRYAKWRYEDLPIIPQNWRHVPTENTQKQLKLLSSLMGRSDVGTIINACDAGREGELIFRLVYVHAKCKKPIQRLWISSMEESAIADGFRNLRPGSDYNLLYHSAICRQRADWLVGMNCSRLFSVLYNVPLRVGRVQTPTLAMIVDREEKINNFVSEPFYIVELNGGGFTAEREKLKDKNIADEICDKCNGKIAVIKTVKKQNKSMSAPKLYDLTTLQREANRLFGYTASATLTYTQSLYEKKLVTYPRTDSRFLSKDMAAGISPLVQNVAGILPFPLPTGGIGTITVNQVINNAKVTDHHAIIPTPSAPKANIASLPGGEKNIFVLICTRLISAVSEKHLYAETIVTTECESEIFMAKGRMVLHNGWKSIEQALVQSLGRTVKGEDKPLPELKEKDEFTAETSVREGHTQPPKHYTEDMLLSAMESAGAEDMPEDAERKGIGTPATRASIIETLVKSGFLERKGKLLLPTDKGVNLTKILPDSVKSPKLTAEWEHSLKGVEGGGVSGGDFMKSINAFVGDIINSNNAAIAEYQALFPSERFAKEAGEIIGVCPRCNGNVSETKKGFFCGNNACKFALWKDNRFFTAVKKKLTKKIAKSLIADGRVAISGLYSEKTGKTFDGVVILDSKGEGYPGYRLEASSN